MSVTTSGVIIIVLGCIFGAYAIAKVLKRKLCPPSAAEDLAAARERENKVLARASRWVIKFKIAVSFMQVRARCTRMPCL